MRIRLTKTIVPYKLSRELIAAGVPLLRDVAPILTNGLYIPLVDESQGDTLLPVIEATIEAHDGIDDIAATEADAETRMQAVPGWATWTEAEALVWFDTNITPLAIPADVKTLLRAYGRVLLALRDKTWPEL
jgi:hypothetical protein